MAKLRAIHLPSKEVFFLDKLLSSESLAKSCAAVSVWDYYKGPWWIHIAEGVDGLIEIYCAYHGRTAVKGSGFYNLGELHDVVIEYLQRDDLLYSLW